MLRFYNPKVRLDQRVRLEVLASEGLYHLVREVLPEYIHQFGNDPWIREYKKTYAHQLADMITTQR